MKIKPPSLEPLEQRVDTLSTPQKILAVVLSVLVLAAAFYFLKYQSQAKRIRRLKSSIRSQQSRLSTLKRYAKESGKLKKELEKSEEEFQVLLALLPSRREIPELLETVSRIGAQEGLENLLFQPQGEQRKEFHATIPVRLDLVGRYHQLGLFLDKISRLDRIIQVSSLSMKRRNDSSLQVTCTLKTFRFLEEHERKPPNEGKKGKKKRKRR